MTPEVTAIFAKSRPARVRKATRCGAEAEAVRRCFISSGSDCASSRCSMVDTRSTKLSAAGVVALDVWQG